MLHITHINISYKLVCVPIRMPIFAFNLKKNKLDYCFLYIFRIFSSSYKPIKFLYISMYLFTELNKFKVYFIKSLSIVFYNIL